SSIFNLQSSIFNLQSSIYILTFDYKGYIQFVNDRVYDRQFFRLTFFYISAIVVLVFFHDETAFFSYTITVIVLDELFKKEQKWTK
ncbi:MAG: hypothetical protein AAB116_04300, partial [Candidatus Poribacteria bacterium]